MAGGLLSRVVSALTTARVAAKPMVEQGVAGFGVYGGYPSSNERNPKLSGANRWVTAQDFLSNISIIAASVRYSLNLISRPAWRADPPSDKPEAKAMAEFVEEVLNGVDTSWARIIRRSAVYRYHGFNLQEWVAKKRDDGKIGLGAVEPRPAHTIRKWDTDANGGILGVVQVSPQTGEELYLPRQKLVYLVDDMLTDHPEGMGWFRHMAEPVERLRRYLKLETMGFERDLSGIPIGRAPMQQINAMVTAGNITRKEADKMIDDLHSFVSMQAKEPSTGLVFDSEPFRSKSADGETVSSVMQWGMDLLTGSSTSAAALGAAIERLQYDMALVIGTESLLVGAKGQGSRALSEDKSKNLYLTSNAALSDMAEAYDRDIVTPLWNMNGFPEELRPKLKTEDVSFKDAATIAKALADMATAGAILDPNDPAINDLRDIMGVSHAPPVDDATAALMLGAKAGLQPPGNDPNTGGGSGGQGGRPSRENPDGGAGGKPKPGEGAAATKYSDDQPRDYHGRWTSGGGGGSVMFEVSPNPDNKALADRWNKLSDAQKQEITSKLTDEFAPQVLDALGVKGSVDPALGGFEGEINPSLVMTVDKKPFEVAGAVGDTFGQKAMVVMSDRPGAGLSPVGMVSVIAPGVNEGKLQEMQSSLGNLADGFTYHNGRMQILNFSGKDDATFAGEVDQALGGNYMVEHTTVYSAYIEESNYARPTGDAAKGPWGQVSGDVRTAFSQRLEEELGKAGSP